MNEFQKAITIAFEKEAAKFDDMLVISKTIQKQNVAPVLAERSNDTIWMPQPYIANSYSGRDQTANFDAVAQLAVPTRQGFEESVPYRMSSPEVRDMLQSERLFTAGIQQIASKINISALNVASNQSTLTVKRTVAASGYDDVGSAEALMHEQGVVGMDRYFGYSPRDFISAASNLQGRGTVDGIVQGAYERSLIRRIGDFDVLKMDYANRLTAATGTSVTVTSADQYYVPVGTALTASGERYPVDNRYQTINLTVGGGAVKAGDRFTIAGVNAVHHITKQSTGQPKTFVVITAPAGGGTGSYVISPPIISAGGGTRPELQYQNVDATPAGGAQLTFLNTVAGYLNPFYMKDSLVLTPGKVAVEADTGLLVRRVTTESGIELVMSMSTSVDNLDLKMRIDAKWGVTNLNPEMNGVVLFSQS